MLPISLYKTIEKKYTERGYDWVGATTKRIIRFREWCCTEDELRPWIEASRIRFIPSGLSKYGSSFAFPIYDPYDGYSMIHFRYEDPTEHGNFRSYTMGDINEHLGPLWSNGSPDTLKQIIETGKVLIVEGPMDQLASQVVGSKYPVLALLGKNIRDKHISDLKMLGVHHIKLMLDREATKEAEELKAKLPFNTTVLKCPAHDPSDCLKDPVMRAKLYKLLN